MATVNYPDNSHSAREQQKERSSERKLEKVVTGGATKRKKTEVRKFAGLFIPEDVEDIKSYILRDVIIPGIKNGIADAVSIILFGNTGKLGRSSKSSASKTSYQRYYRDERDDSRSSNRSATAAGYDYDDILFDDRGDAELVLEQMQEAINQYDVVSVADYYDLAGVSNTNYSANRYGWVDIYSAKVVRTRDGYVIQLPRPKQIN